jgi:hypothetical protein
MPMALAMMRLTSDGGVELALALAALGGEVPHEVLVGVTQDVVVLGAVLGEIERGVLEDGDEVAQLLDLLRAVAELVWIVEVRESRCGRGGELASISG